MFNECTHPYLSKGVEDLQNFRLIFRRCRNREKTFAMRPERGRIPNSSDIVIIGAGPYGLSIAAHFRAKDVQHQIFGRFLASHVAQSSRRFDFQITWLEALG
jgi:hypothetical protein